MYTGNWSVFNWLAINRRVFKLQKKIQQSMETKDWHMVKYYQKAFVLNLCSRFKIIQEIAVDQSELLFLSNSSQKRLYSLLLSQKFNYSKINYTKLNIVNYANLLLWQAALDPIHQIQKVIKNNLHDKQNYLEIIDIFTNQPSLQWVLTTKIVPNNHQLIFKWLKQEFTIDLDILRFWYRNYFFRDNVLVVMANYNLNNVNYIDFFLIYLIRTFHMYVYRFTINKSKYLKIETRPKFFISHIKSNFLATGLNYQDIEILLYSIMRFIIKRGFRLSRKATYIHHIDEGFVFYEWLFLKKSLTNIIGTVASEIVKLHKQRIKSLTIKSKNISACHFVTKLNVEIDLWTKQYNYTDMSHHLVTELNQYLHKLIWKWARKRHPKRNKNWIFRHYWQRLDGQWAFVAYNDKNHTYFNKLRKYSKHPNIKYENLYNQ